MARIKKSHGLKLSEIWREDLGPWYYVQGGSLRRRGRISGWWIFKWADGDPFIGGISCDPDDGHVIRLWRSNHDEAEALAEKLKGKKYTIILE